VIIRKFKIIRYKKTFFIVLKEILEREKIKRRIELHKKNVRTKLIFAHFSAPKKIGLKQK